MIDRRSLIGAMATVPLAARVAAQTAPAAPAMTPWPPAEHFPLWPGRPPGARATLPTPNPSGNFIKITQRVPVKIDMVEMPKPLSPGMMVEVEIDAR